MTAPHESGNFKSQEVLGTHWGYAYEAKPSVNNFVNGSVKGWDSGLLARRPSLRWGQPVPRLPCTVERLPQMRKQWFCLKAIWFPTERKYSLGSNVGSWLKSLENESQYEFAFTPGCKMSHLSELMRTWGFYMPHVHAGRSAWRGHSLDKEKETKGDREGAGIWKVMVTPWSPVLNFCNL